MRDPNRPRLRDYAYGQRHPERVHVTVHAGGRAVVYHGTDRVRGYDNHGDAMRFAQWLARQFAALDQAAADMFALHDRMPPDTFPRPMEAP